MYFCRLYKYQEEMKRSFWILFMACVCLSLSACQNKKKNTPEAVAEQFAKAFYTADFTHMYQYSSKKTQVVIQNLQSAMKEHADRQEEMSKQKVVFVNTTVDSQTDSTAMCTCKVTIDERPRTDVWELVKENGDWKVTMIGGM